MKNLFLIMLLVISLPVCAQEKILLQGKITNIKDVEGIHILNRSSRYNSVSDRYGNFAITVKAGDSLLFSSVQFEPLEVEVTPEIFEKSLLIVNLIELVNELDEVKLGPDLSGVLKTDIEKIEVKDPVNFQDLGIPGFTGIPEEKIIPITAAFNPTRVDLEAMYKYLSGYYRKLKIRRKWDKENVAVAGLLENYPAGFLEESFGIPENRSYDFVLFCVETSEIAQWYRSGRYPDVWEVFSVQSKVYLDRMNSREE